MGFSYKEGTIFNTAYIFKALIISCFLLSPAFAPAGEKAKIIDGGVILRDTTLEGDIIVEKDLYVPKGVTLQISHGAVVRFKKSESSKVEPENLLRGTEITVRGTLEADRAKLIFNGDGGIAVDGGNLHLYGSLISGAEYGVLLISGEMRAGDSLIEGCETGILIGDMEGVKVSFERGGLEVRGCARGGIVPEGFDQGPLFRVTSAKEQALLSHNNGNIIGISPQSGSHGADLEGFAPGEVYEDLFLEKDSEWKGDILVKGTVRVSPVAHLTIRAGTRVLFDFRDTNGDGIGESGIFLQGTIDVRGKEDNPVIFASAGKRGKGRWDSINFLASDLEENRIEYAVIMDSYRGVHSHFSRVLLRNVSIYGAFRGIQFQESEVKMESINIINTTSGLRCRDSDVNVDGFNAIGIITGANFLRVKGRVNNIEVSDGLLFGVRIRESELGMDEPKVSGGLYSFSLQEGKVTISGLEQSGAVIAGIQAKRSNLMISGSKVTGNRVYGLSLKGGKCTLDRVKISGSGVEEINLEEDPEVIIVR